MFYVQNFVLGFTFVLQTKHFNSKDSMMIGPGHFHPSQVQMKYIGPFVFLKDYLEISND